MAQLVQEARSTTSVSARHSPRGSGVPMRCTRSPRCRPSTRSGPATPRMASWTPAASSAWASSPTCRSAAASSRARSAPSTASPPTGVGRSSVPGRELPVQPRPRRRGRAARRREGHHARAPRASVGPRAGQDIVPIPGTGRRIRLDDNVGALELELTEDDLPRMHEAMPRVSGRRYPQADHGRAQRLTGPPGRHPVVSTIAEALPWWRTA
jgi:hypothetical protein